MISIDLWVYTRRLILQGLMGARLVYWMERLINSS